MIGTFELPWVVIGPAMVLAVVATYFAASRPARAITRVPIVTALSGRPAPPKQVHRSAVPGVVLLVVAAFLLSYAGSSGNGGGAPELVFGFVALIAAVILLAPFCLAVLARLGRRAPIAVRLALRDLARYRARSGSALAAISLGVLIAVLVCVLSAARYGNVLDYAGPNLASNQLIVYTPNGAYGRRRPGQARRSGPATGEQAAVDGGAGARHRRRARLPRRRPARLDRAPRSSTPRPGATGPDRCTSPPRSCCGPSGSSAPQVDPAADILTMRPGLSGISKHAAHLRQRPPGQRAGPAAARPGRRLPLPDEQCLANPVIQEVSALPSGTSAPNTVITEHAMHAARPAGQRGRLADPDPEPAHRRADQQRQADRGRGGPDHRDQVQRALVGGDHQLGHRVRHRSWRWASWP